MSADSQDIALSDVAIIGMSCRLPGANNPGEFWDRICAAEELLVTFDDDELRAMGVSEELLKNPNFQRVSALIDHAGDFDAEFFRIAPSEARLIDPQHRLFLELCWHALEDAGYNPDTYPHGIGVFAGCGRHAYLRYVEPHFSDGDYLDGSVLGLQSDIGNYGDFLATRVSYKLGLRGPSLNVQTACSTGLVSVHLACQSLLLGETDIALAGAVNLHTPQINGYLYEEGSICSREGHLRPFDARADGSVFGNGGGVVVLKRLREAIADGDRLIAVIKGTAINNDGADKVSFTAPSIHGQADVVKRAQQAADVDSRTIGYVETHGTGTLLGDPIEIAALQSAFDARKNAQPFCALGAVKAQIGHLGPAAGIVGLIKAALVVERGQIPPCANFTTPNPNLKLDDSPFYVPRHARTWHGLRRAGVSAFGVGGTNAHAVLEQAPRTHVPRASPDKPVPIVVSAASERALADARSALGAHLRDTPDLQLGDVAYVLGTGRRRLPYRVAVSATTTTEAAARLVDQVRWPAVYDPRADLPVVFAFSGMGAQYVGMGRALYRGDHRFRSVVDTCLAALVSAEGLDLGGVLLAEGDRAVEASVLLKTPCWGQPGIFVIQYALAKALQQTGMNPDVMIGHSLGEFAAACLAGVFSVEDALRIVAARGRLMSGTAPGAMMAVGLPASQLAGILPRNLDLAAINAPEQTVVSGTTDAIAKFEEQLARTEIRHTVLGTSVGAHSSTMDSILEEFQSVVCSARLSPPEIPIASTLTGSIVGPSEMASTEYWVRHLREPVRFMKAAEEIAQRGPVVVVELGPGRGLSGLYRQSEGDLGSATVTPLVYGEPEPGSLAALAGAVWMNGGKIDWATALTDQKPQRVALPGYPFERSTHWITAPRDGSAATTIPPLGRRLTSWLQVPEWRAAPLQHRDEERLTRRVLALVPEQGSAIVERLNEAGCQVVERVNAPGIVAPNIEEDLQRLHAGHCDTVLLVANPAPVAERWSLQAGVNETLITGFWRLLEIVRQLSLRQTAQPVDVVIVTKQRHLLVTDTALRPELALLTGPALVLPQEYPNVRVIELDFAQSETEREIGRVVCSELAQPPSCATAAYRAGQRYVLHYSPVQQNLGAKPWKEGGRYLITGGLGGIGLTLAEEAARTPGVEIILTHRTALPDQALMQRLLADFATPADLRRRLEGLARLQASGTVIHCVQADVADRRAMQRIHDSYGPFIGIVHGAGVPDGHLIDKLSHEQAVRVLAPKVEGTLVLNETVVDETTEWLALCSSMSAAVGGLGHASYCSANAFLDAFATWRRNFGLRTVSIAYDAWAEIGMALNEAERSRKARAIEGYSPNARLRATDQSVFSAEWSDSDTAEFHGHLRQGNDWLVDEHKLQGQALLPGTAIVEYIRAAAARHLGLQRVCLVEVDLVRPLVVPPGQGVRIAAVLSRKDGAMRAKLVSRLPEESEWRENAIAYIGDAPEGPFVDPIVLSASSVGDAAGIKILKSGAMTFGPRWESLVRATREAEDRLVVECALPSEFIGDLERYGIHPALLDIAAGSFLPLMDGGTYLPLSYERIDIHRNMPARIRSRITRRNISKSGLVTFDVAVHDEHERPILDITGYTLRKVDPAALAAEFARQTVLAPPAANRCLVTANAGDLSALSFAQCERKSPAANEVEIQILATGLNFKEVLIATGMLDPGQANYHFGLEGAGIVTAAGVNVTRLRPGDPVMVIGASCFSDFICLNEASALPIPKGLNFAQAASVPVAFTTAYDSLINIAGLRAGERVLVHAVTGGVGMAALQIARQAGAIVFGTAGSELKREFARQVGVELVMDSRSMQFEQQTIEAGGVDVVLNSLSGDFIAAGLRTLRPRGRFVELGRRDILAGSLLDLNLFATGTSFMAYYPDPSSGTFLQVFNKVAGMLVRREIEPLPLHCVSLENVAEAFAFMARAQHIGKVVVVRPGAEQIVTRGGDAVTNGSATITPAIGLRALRGALALGAPRVLVTTRSMDGNDRAAPVVAEHALQVMKDAPIRARIMTKCEFVPLEGQTELRLGKIWSNVLSIGEIGREDHFLDLGGDSLYATQVSARVRSEFGVRIGPSSMLGDLPLFEIARIIDQHLVKETSR